MRAPEASGRPGPGSGRSTPGLTARVARVATLDHELDLWWSADADRYVFKDVEIFAQRLVEGRYPGMGPAIRAEGDRIAALLDADERWWDKSWAAWQPDPAWPVPRLPAGWASVPC